MSASSNKDRLSEIRSSSAKDRVQSAKIIRAQSAAMRAQSDSHSFDISSMLIPSSQSSKSLLASTTPQFSKPTTPSSSNTVDQKEDRQATPIVTKAMESIRTQTPSTNDLLTLEPLAFAQLLERVIDKLNLPATGPAFPDHTDPQTKLKTLNGVVTELSKRQASMQKTLTAQEARINSLLEEVVYLKNKQNVDIIVESQINRVKKEKVIVPYHIQVEEMIAKLKELSKLQKNEWRETIETSKSVDNQIQEDSDTNNQTDVVESKPEAENQITEKDQGNKITREMIVETANMLAAKKKFEPQTSLAIGLAAAGQKQVTKKNPYVFVYKGRARQEASTFRKEGPVIAQSVHCIFY